MSYRDVPMFSDGQAYANSADPVQTAPREGLHCLPFHLQLVDKFLYSEIILLKFKDDYSNIFGVRKHRKITIPETHFII